MTSQAIMGFQRKRVLWRFLAWCVLGVLLALVSVGCLPFQTSCQVGDVSRCPCPGSADGRKSCAADGIWLPCSCANSPGGSNVKAILLTTSGGQRIFVSLKEDGAPCVGVERIEIIVDALEVQQEPLTHWVRTADATKDAFFWVSDSGKCRFPNGVILLKGIPSGGQRRLSVRMLDASGRLISYGESTVFSTDKNASEAPVLTLWRGCVVIKNGSCIKRDPTWASNYGTVILSFPTAAPVPSGAQVLVFQTQLQNGKSQRRIDLKQGMTPSFVMLGGLATIEGQLFTLSAFGRAGTQIRSWSGSYSLPNADEPSSLAARVLLESKE